MLGCTERLTLRRAVYDPDLDADSLHEMVLPGVSVQGAAAIWPGKTGPTSRDILKVRVPLALCRDYLAPDGWWVAPGDVAVYKGVEYTVCAVHNDLERRLNPHVYLELR